MKALSFKPLILIGLFFLIWSCKSFAQAKFPEPLSGDENGFVPIFDGKSFTGWEGDPVYWRIENGTIVGEVTPETILKRNSFLIWRGGTTGNFELKLEYKVSAEGNSGINYRSFDVEGVPFALRATNAILMGKESGPGKTMKRGDGNFWRFADRLLKLIPGKKLLKWAALGIKNNC